MTLESIIRGLTLCALAGLLGTVGLRLTWRQVATSHRQCRFALIVVTNFVLVPLLAVGAIRLLNVPREPATALMLLAAAPFAPVVPIFARMARADLGLAAVLSSIFLILAAVMTPLVCALLLPIATGVHGMGFSVIRSLPMLLGSLIVPLGLGVWLHHSAPALARRLLKPIEVTAEAMGAISLAFVTFAELRTLEEVGWRSVVATALVSEVAFAFGYLGGIGWTGARRVTALGASNRNIALALLLSLDSFGGTKVVAGVVANGLLLIALGLVHVGFWRLRDTFWPPATRPDLVTGDRPG